MAKKSDIANRRVIMISYGLDTDIFNPCNKVQVRKELCIDEGRVLVLFGGINAEKDKRKGFDLFQESLSYLKDSFSPSKVNIGIFGSAKLGRKNIEGFNIYDFGVIKDESHLAKIYSAADVTVVASRQETFGQE